MDNKKFRYHHLGIPTLEKLPNEKYLPEFDIYVSGYEDNDFNIEWMRFGDNCKLPESIKTLPHIAFEVDDIYEAVKGYEIIVDINSPSKDVLVAFVLIQNAPVEFLQICDY